MESLFDRQAFMKEKVDKILYPYNMLPAGLRWYYYLDKSLEKGNKIFKTIFCLFNKKERDCLIRIAKEESQNEYKIGSDSYRKFKI